MSTEEEFRVTKDAEEPAFLWAMVRGMLGTVGAISIRSVNSSQYLVLKSMIWPSTPPNSSTAELLVLSAQDLRTLDFGLGLGNFMVRKF